MYYSAFHCIASLVIIALGAGPALLVRTDIDRKFSKLPGSKILMPPALSTIFHVVLRVSFIFSQTKFSHFSDGDEDGCNDDVNDWEASKLAESSNLFLHPLS